MPIKIRAKGSKFQVYNAETGKVLGTVSSKAKARAMIAAMKKKGVDVEGKGEMPMSQPGMPPPDMMGQ